MKVIRREMLSLPFALLLLHRGDFIGGASRDTLAGMSRVTSQAAFVVALAASSASCSASSPQDGGLPDAVVLRVDRVVVAPMRPRTQDPWDGPAPEDQGQAICSLVTAGVELASPVVGKSAERLCGLFQPPQRENAPTNPDLQVRLIAGGVVRFDSPVKPDVAEDLFGSEFVVPLAAVPPDGLEFQVLDIDRVQASETIGAPRLSSAQIVDTLRSPTQLIDLASDAVLHLEVVVHAYSPTKLVLTSADAAAGPLAIGSRKLAAGEIVTLHADGAYKVGSWYNAPVDPVGYPGGSARSYNFDNEPFKSAPHACGIALVGDGGIVQGALIKPDGTFQVQHSGVLRVGLNDSDPSNNRGWITFQGVARAPTVVEWEQRRQ